MLTVNHRQRQRRLGCCFVLAAAARGCVNLFDAVLAQDGPGLAQAKGVVRPKERRAVAASLSQEKGFRAAGVLAHERCQIVRDAVNRPQVVVRRVAAAVAVDFEDMATMVIPQ